MLFYLQEAVRLAKADEQRLLKHHKLVLVVDLDQTLIHTTMDAVPATLKGENNTVASPEIPHQGVQVPWQGGPRHYNLGGTNQESQHRPQSLGQSTKKII